MKHLTLALGSTLLLIGCGGGSDSTSASTSYDISVERGPILGAIIKDSKNKSAISLGNGEYRFTSAPVFPITTYGGYIDVNRNNIIDSGDMALTFSLKSNTAAKALTIVGTMANDSTLKTYLINTFGVTDEQIANDTPQENLKIGIISNYVHRYLLTHNLQIENLTTAHLDTIKTDILNEITSVTNTYNTQYLITQEQAIATDFNLALTQEAISEAQTVIETINSTLSSSDPSTLTQALPAGILSDTQKADLVYMYEEEKLAHDVYLTLYNQWGLKTFYNIAQSETQHMDSVKALLEKYGLHIPSNTPNVFENSSLNSLYTQLVAQGQGSASNALQVGIDIENLDIRDLQEKNINVPSDVKLVYDSLMNGSYNHLNAFTKMKAKY